MIDFSTLATCIPKDWKGIYKPRYVYPKSRVPIPRGILSLHPFRPSLRSLLSLNLIPWRSLPFFSTEFAPLSHERTQFLHRPKKPSVDYASTALKADPKARRPLEKEKALKPGKTESALFASSMEEKAFFASRQCAMFSRIGRGRGVPLSLTHDLDPRKAPK